MSIAILRPARHILMFSILLPAFAATSIVSIEPTQMQAKITVHTDQTGSCTYRASRGSAFSVNIPDLVDNANTDARAGSVVNTGVHIFILGTRKGNDGLAAAASYWVGVTCGTDAEVSSVFQTRPIQWGNTAPDIVPFNAAKFGNMDHPAIDWNGTAAASTFADPATHSYTDPNTGVEYWLVSKAGWGTQAAIITAAMQNWPGIPIDLSGTGKFTNPTQAAYHSSAPSVLATATGGATDKLFIPIQNFGCQQGGSLAGFSGSCTVDDISFTVWCGNATSGGVTGFNLQLTADGGQTLVGNVITTNNCPASAPAQLNVYPGNTVNPVANPIFKLWGYVPRRNMIIPPFGNVNVSGNAVTLTGSTNPYNYFNLDWTAGTPILINGGYAHLAAAPTSSTTLTIVENLGTLTNVAYSGANFGVVLTKTNSSSSRVDFSIGMNYAFSQMPDQGQNGDREMLNKASVAVSRSADGATCGTYTVGCSAGVLNPPLTGYLGYTNNAAIFLWIPRNSDGSPRGETRLLSQNWKPSASARITWNGDTPFSVQLLTTHAFDDSDGASIYAQDGTSHIWKLTYNEAYTGCAGYVAFHPFPTSGDYAFGALADDCFHWQNITPTTGGHTIKNQIMGSDGVSGAYQTGLNYLGQTVGPSHAGFDLGWAGVGMADVGSEPPGMVMVTALAAQNHLGILAAFGNDGTGLYTVKSIRNMWNEGALRWGGLHTCPETNMGSMEFCALDPLDNTNRTDLIFPNRNQATISQVNRAGFGSLAAWDSNTSISSNTDFYTCPSGLPAPFTSLSGTANCLQVRVNTPFCQVTPNSSYIFHDGNTEKQEFPCTTPGFGVADATRSKLQDIAVGDWLFSTDKGGSSNTGERFVVLTAPVYNSATDITFWILRMAGFVYLQPTYGGNALDETNGIGHSAGGQGCCTHSGAWGLWAANSLTGGSAAIDVSSPANTWLTDNPVRFAAHGVAGAGTLPGTYSYSQGDCGPNFNIFCGTSNLTAAASVNALFSNTVVLPSFAGLQQPLAGMQTYQSASQAPGTSALPFFVDFKAINPSSPGGAEAGNSFGSMNTSLVPGTTHTYSVAADCCNGTADYKRWGVQGYAGRFWTRDVSSPTTFASAADLPNYSVCWARKTNECVFGATAGKLYISISSLDARSACYSANFGLAVPCLSSFGPITGQVVQFRNDRVDNTGTSYRKFGFAHSHVGLGYPFSNCRTTPDAQFLFCPGYWMDGVRTDWLALRIDALPPVDNVDRTSFVPIQLAYQGVPFAANIRARFGYAENGGDLLQCTAYAQDCSTEIPSGAPSDPFSFTNEAVTRQTCANGVSCTITIPSLPNRMLYYVVDRIDSSGVVLETSPLQVVAVP